MRGFRSRSVGPGTYKYIDTTNFLPDETGDIKFELNTEFRFRLSGPLYGALFVDAGNIWLRNYQKSFPNGDFNLSSHGTSEFFVNQIAVGAGMGIRLDFNFFILRLDGAFKLKDPARKAGDRWMVNKPLETVLNFGIGYPF